MFNINQIVKAKYGHFIVLGYRTVAGEPLVQVKLYNPLTGETDKGEMASPNQARRQEHIPRSIHRHRRSSSSIQRGCT
jgi:hypothetical protein